MNRELNNEKDRGNMADKKLSVLIVDDEFRIGMLIRKLIHWTELEMECVDVLEDGETAIDVIREKQPDIVITDIRMPKITGLDLIKMAYDSEMNVHFIVVSGYKEFEYAHKAMSYGVENYILKPVNEEELNKTLWKISKKIIEQNDFDLRQKKLQETVVESNKIIRQNFLKNIIDQKENSNSSSADICMTGEIYRGIDIKLDHIDVACVDEKQDARAVADIMSIVEAAIKGNSQEFLLCEKEYLHIYCVFNYDAGERKTIQHLISDVLLKIKEYLMGFDQYEVTIGIGSEQTAFSQIRFSILESYRAVCSRMCCGTGRLIYSEDVPENSDSKLKKRFEEAKEGLYASIDAYSEEQLEEYVTEIFRETVSDTADMTEYYLTAEKLVELFFYHLNQEELETQKKVLQSKCQHCYKLRQLTQLLVQELGSCLKMLRESEKTKSIKPIRQAKEYVEEHFREKILLEDIAAVVDLNPVYFSALFKKETDMNFSTYLINVRMEQAKKMLISTNDTIAAIGDAVGYGDQKYFSQLFKKVVGVKPAIYRRLHS